MKQVVGGGLDSNNFSSDQNLVIWNINSILSIHEHDACTSYLSVKFSPLEFFVFK